MKIKRMNGMAAVVVLALAMWSTPATAKDFASWLQQLRRDAVAQGVSQQTVDAALTDSLQPIPRIIELDRKQPEKTRTFAQYVESVVSTDRRDKGRTRYLNNKQLLTEIGDKYGVDPATIVALWGVETSYGAITGGYNIINALATLAYDGRRADFFRAELIKALQIVDGKHIDLADFKGSWAGAMGQCQFMPSSFMRYAVDHDGDGRRDIWGTQADVFASAANYLAESGWKRGQSWGHEVQTPKNISRDLVGLDKEYPLSFWRDQNIRGLAGQSVADDAVLKASLVQPDGPSGRSFLVYDNYKVIMKWNKSTYFATSVGLLSDHIRSGKSVSVAKPKAKASSPAPVTAVPATVTTPADFNN